MTAFPYVIEEGRLAKGVNDLVWAHTAFDPLRSSLRSALGENNGETIDRLISQATDEDPYLISLLNAYTVGQPHFSLIEDHTFRASRYGDEYDSLNRAYLVISLVEKYFDLRESWVNDKVQRGDYASKRTELQRLAIHIQYQQNLYACLSQTDRVRSELNDLRAREQEIDEKLKKLEDIQSPTADHVYEKDEGERPMFRRLLDFKFIVRLAVAAGLIAGGLSLLSANYMELAFLMIGMGFEELFSLAKDEL